MNRSDELNTAEKLKYLSAVILSICNENKIPLLIEIGDFFAYMNKEAIEKEKQKEERMKKLDAILDDDGEQNE